MRSLRPLLATAASAGVFTLIGLGTAEMAAPRAVAGPPIKAADNYGTIKGRLVWGGDTVPEPKSLNTANQPFCKDQALTDNGLAIDPATKGVANAFAYLPSPKGKNADAEKALLSKEPTVVIDNKNCEFVPYSTAMMKGQLLQFKSEDPVGHNSHYTGFSNNNNLSLVPKGKTQELKLQSEKTMIKLKCDIHSWMDGWIMVFDHPFFAVTGKDGSFEITGVPVGTQNLIVRHGPVGFVTPGGSKGITVEVKAGATTTVPDIVLEPSKVKK